MQFRLRPLPAIDHVNAFAESESFNPLESLPGLWKGTGFNVIWRPDSKDKTQKHFLELNLTTEELEFSGSIGSIANRGLLQEDIVMQGLTYMQRIVDANLLAPIHIEPGIWATVPATTAPRVPTTVVRMASIPHGTTLVAQGRAIQGGNTRIPDNDIRPFRFGNPEKPIDNIMTSDLGDLTRKSQRPIDAQLVGITQRMVDNPNSVLQDVIAQQVISKTIQIDVSTSTKNIIVGGGTTNTAFLTGDNGGPNAAADSMTATFWIQNVKGQGGGADFLQLQYSQRVLLGFAGNSWPHVSVATLRKVSS